MADKFLLVTLGHNSSAMFVAKQEESEQLYVIGYEQERLSRIKGDSQFPIDAINEIIYNVGLNTVKGCKVYVSHWFNSFEGNMPNKYISTEDMAFLESLSSEKLNITYTSGLPIEGPSHHDAHAMSAYAFYDSFKIESSKVPTFCIVADGFGNDEEVLSIYRRDDKHRPELLHRTYGYEHSLGLMYQYATSFVGMKENQDEYKFLGYESHIKEVFSDKQIDAIEKEAFNVIADFVTAFNDKKNSIRPKYVGTQIINFDRLKEVKKSWNSTFTHLMYMLGYSDGDDFTHDYTTRVAIAYFVQYIVENVMTQVVGSYGIINLCVAGGLFYNVKLNNVLLRSIPGKFSVMPLAGDQGAAIGMLLPWLKANKLNFPFGTLSIGPRRLYNIEKFADNSNIFVRHESDVFINANDMATIVNFICDGYIVNLVRANMEFGPRALCSTSSLFLPNEFLVRENNHNNKRNEVMPCAPVCTYDNATALFDENELNRVVGSDYFMICTHEYQMPRSLYYDGVMHKKPLTTEYTGRPQIITRETDELMYTILKAVEERTGQRCLVNTSFNNHGNPIVFDTAEIIANHKYQCERAEYAGRKKPVLFILK